MKQYIKLSSLIFSEDNITKEKRDDFMDMFIELVEKFEFVSASTFALMTEKEAVKDIENE